MKKLFFILISLLVVLIACKSSKGVIDGSAESISSKTLYKQVKENNFDFETFSGKAKMRFEDKSMDQSFTAHFRIERDKTIWISLTGPFSIEGVRVLISQDSIEIIDKLNGRYYKQPFSFMSQYIPFEADFAFVQALIIGNSLGEMHKKQDILIQDEMYTAKGQIGNIDAEYTILPTNHKYHKILLSDNAYEREATMSFTGYKDTDSQPFAMYRTLNFADAQNDVYIQMEFKNVKIGEELTFPFRISDKYERIE
ncbi:MAG: DUF4292 domain-containing protein [Chitinophagales bacterium]